MVIESRGVSIIRDWPDREDPLFHILLHPNVINLWDKFVDLNLKNVLIYLYFTVVNYAANQLVWFVLEKCVSPLIRLISAKPPQIEQYGKYN